MAKSKVMDKIGIVVAGLVMALVLTLIWKLYLRDSETVQKAIVVEAFFHDFCAKNNRYPSYEEVKGKFPDLYNGKEWYYWPNEELTAATFQYPVTLSLPSAPGRSKYSEFFPVIYSFAVSAPCQDILSP